MQLTKSEKEMFDTMADRRTDQWFVAPDGELDPDGNEPGEYRCPECGRRVTVGQSGVEYGHQRRKRCPRRPKEVDSSYEN